MATAYKDMTQARERAGHESDFEQDERDAAESRQQRILEAARGALDRLEMEANERVRLKQPIERRWIENLRNYFGKYIEPKKEAGPVQADNRKRSTVFVNMTRPKTDSWAARIEDILFPTDDKNWGIEPTPVPKLVQEAQKFVAQAEAATESLNAAENPEQQARMKEIADSFAQQVRTTNAEIDEAKRRCKRMEDVIEDQLVQSNYVAECRDIINDGCRLGTGILKGPVTGHKLRAEWRPKTGFWELNKVPDPLPGWRRVDPWHFFPDMSAGRMRDSESEFERHLPTPKRLRTLAKELDFDKEATRRLLRAGPAPAGLEIEHLTLLREIVGEGEAVTGRYCLWEYHGSLEPHEIANLLRATGKGKKAEKYETEIDELDDHRVILWFCQGEVLKIEPLYPMESGEGLYSVWNFSKGETSVFGIGVPHLMADPQAALNGAWRMMMDNAGNSVGPQILVNKLAVQPQDGDWNFRPNKTWLLSSTAGVLPGVPAFQTFDVPINTEALVAIINLAKLFIDEETGMPQIAQGDQGQASKTLGGMSMLFNSANVVFRHVVKTWDDDLTTPSIRRAFDWNMQFHPDESIKGDMQIEARGTSVLLVREIQSQSLMQIMTNWTTHPEIGPWLKVREGLEETLKTMMIPPNNILRSQEEYDTIIRAQQEAAANQPQDPTLAVAQLRADTDLQIAQMRLEAEMMKFEQQTGLSREEIGQRFNIDMSRLEVEREKLRSSERRDAVKIAIEDKRAKVAQQQGESASKATGTGIG